MGIVASYEVYDGYVALCPNVPYGPNGLRQQFVLETGATITGLYIHTPSITPVSVEIYLLRDGYTSTYCSCWVPLGSGPGWIGGNIEPIWVPAGTWWIGVGGWFTQTGVPLLISTDSTDGYGKPTEYWDNLWYVLNQDMAFRILGPTSKATNPTPSDNAYGVVLNLPYLQWEHEDPTVLFNVYFKKSSGENFGFFTQIASEISDTFIYLPDVIDYESAFPGGGKIAPLEYGGEYGDGEGYYWRVDSVVGEETIQGDVWSFSTISFKPPLPTGLTLNPGETEPTGTATGQNAMNTVRRLVAFAKNSVFYET